MFSSLAVEMSAGLGAAGLAAGAYAYAAMWPASQLFGQTLIAPRNAPGRPGELALTFDDGPNPAWTPQLLELLASYDVRATFFLVGRYAQAEPELVRRIANAGHLIGNHSWSHPNLAVATDRRIRDELTRTRETLEQITGQPVRYFRPPFGGRRPAALRIARSLGMTPVTWNAITNDWSELSPDRITERLCTKIEKNERRGWATNIVLHDGGHLELGANRGPSVGAAGQIIARYLATHRFVTLEEWCELQSVKQ
jgi:peptidoglycan-N-acetylglucosamine deacetylase